VRHQLQNKTTDDTLLSYKLSASAPLRENYSSRKYTKIWCGINYRTNKKTDDILLSYRLSASAFLREINYTQRNSATKFLIQLF
jgi:hypothetical protein